jgi:DNA-3-methyladenine glycosylase II
MGDDPPARLDDDALHAGVNRLVARDTDLAGIVARHGPPPLWAREPGFATLVHIILEQQVSLRSADAAMGRLVATAGEISAAAIVAAGPERLIPAGLTRQKTRYLLGLSQGVLDGRLDLDALPLADDQTARQQLLGFAGIGPWTADIYLLMALGRPDIWPIGDLALATAMRRAKRLPDVPRSDQQLEVAEMWRPLRAVAARILWHSYLAVER